MNLAWTRRREVPWSVRFTVLFGGVLQSFGWFFFGLGMIFVWVFVPKMDLTSWWQFRGEPQRTSGVVVTVKETRYSQGGSDSGSGTPVFRNDYKFVVGGEEFTRCSFSLGAAVVVGQTVPVEYPAGYPTHSRIAGMRRAPVTSVAVFVVIFPLLGLGFVVYGLRSGWRALALLSRGELSRGRLVAKAPTNMQVNEQPVYKLTFEFTDQAGQPQRAEARTHQPSHLEDDQEEWLLYNSWRPDQAVLLDNLPGRPHFNDDGEIAPGRQLALIRAVVGPVFAVAANVLGLWLAARL